MLIQIYRRLGRRIVCCGILYHLRLLHLLGIFDCWPLLHLCIIRQQNGFMEAPSIYRNNDDIIVIKCPLKQSEQKILHAYLLPTPKLLTSASKPQLNVSSIFLDDKIKQYRMGCSSPQNAGIPNIPAQHLNRLLQVSDIHHQLNVNKKYQHLSKIREGMTVGQGFKKTFAYDCLTTPQEMRGKRKEFWQTRVNGSPECWGAIRLSVEQPDQETGNRILQELRIGMLNNNIQMCVDTKFNKYEVPIFCINQPISYAQETIAEKNMNFDYSDENMQVKVRSVRFPTEDIVLTLKTSTEVGEAKIQLRIAKQIPDNEVIRFFYTGREMIDNKTLGNYSYCVGTIIQAMIR